MSFRSLAYNVAIKSQARHFWRVAILFRPSPLGFSRDSQSRTSLTVVTANPLLQAQQLSLQCQNINHDSSSEGKLCIDNCILLSDQLSNIDIRLRLSTQSRTPLNQCPMLKVKEIAHKNLDDFSHTSCFFFAGDEEKERFRWYEERLRFWFRVSSHCYAHRLTANCFINLQQVC